MITTHVSTLGGGSPKAAMHLRYVLVAAMSVWALRAADAVCAEQHATADTNTGSLQEVVVTAQKRSENIQEVPITVTAITAEELQASGIGNVTDLPMLTSGLNTNQAGQYFYPHLRGIGTSADAASVENPIALYVDGVYIGHQAGSMLNLVNIQQIEVDKGPQGTLFGRNATGGLIQITTVDPKQTPRATVSAGYGNYDTGTGSVYVTGGLTDHLAADFSGYIQDQGNGYGTNLYNGEAVNKTRNIIGRTKWLFTPSDETRVMLILDYNNEKGAPGIKPFPGTQPLGGFVPTRPQDLYVASSYYDRNWEYGASLKITHSFELGDFSSITAYRRSKYVVAFPNSSPDPADITIPLLHENFRQLSQEFQLGSHASSGFTWVAGAFFYFASPGWQPLDIYGPALGPLVISISDEQKTYSGAVYGQTTFPIVEATDLTIGARYTFDRRNWAALESFTPFPIPSVADRQDKTFKKPTWRLSLDHHFTPEVLGFVSYNRGFKSGGFNDSLVPAFAYDPETLDAYETGVKTTLLDRRLRLNTSVFYYDYKNIQVTRFIGGNENVYNGSGAKLYGVDLDLDAQITQALSVRSGIEYLHDKYTSFPLADYTVPAPGGGSIFSTRDASGKRVAFTPDWTATLAVDYRIPVDISGSLLASATYYYNGGWFPNPDNRLKQSAYDLVNASLTWSSRDDRFRLSLWGRNLGNTNYAVLASEQGNGDFIIYAPPRTYGFTATLNLGSSN